MRTHKERRLFLKHIFSSASGFLDTLVSTGHHDPEDEPEMASDIMGDLTPELMEMEAERLGLDPKRDQNRVRQSIQAAMGRPGIKDDNA
jgi:hypothetical protein